MTAAAVSHSRDVQRTRVKICGIRTLDDALGAVQAGADMLGFIFYRPVARYVTPEAVSAVVKHARAAGYVFDAVGVFVDEPAGEVNTIARQCGLDLVQLAGNEPSSYSRDLQVPAIKVLRSGNEPWTADRLRLAREGYDVERFMVDTHLDGFYGGTGVAGDWHALSGFLEASILAGGLTPSNVGAALECTRPWGVDVSSGVEREGRKDADLVRQFIAAVRAYDAAHLASVKER